MSVHVERVNELPRGLCALADGEAPGDDVVWMLESEISERGAAALGPALDERRPAGRPLTIPSADVELTVDDVLNPRRTP